MKKLLCLLMLLAWPVLACAEVGPAGEVLPEEPQWQAKLRAATRIRTVKDMESRAWLGLVPADTPVDVYLVDGDWAICKYGGDVGYVPYERMYQFVITADSPLPGSLWMEGVATMTKEVFLTVEGYTGNTIAVGDVLCTRRLGLVPMMRDRAQLAADSYTFEPFVKAEASKPGDALYGFTTFYNESLAGQYPENRAFNIELAVQRIHGAVIGPGEKFSYNHYCSPYDEANGYKLAKNVSNDGYGFGGGVCQVSTTVFNAIQGFNHRVEAWYLHSFAGVKYALRNQDAAVANGQDFTFYNNEAFPVELQAYAQNGVLTIIFRHAAQ